MRFLVVVFITLWTLPAQAFFLDTNLFYSTDVLTQTTSTTSNKTFYDFAIGFNIDKKGYYQAGWAYDAFSTSDVTGATTTTYSATAMGPKLNFYFGKNRQWVVGLTYGLVSKASYSASGSSSEIWKGATYKGELGYILRAEDSAWFFGIKLNYSSASYAEKIVGSNTYSTVSYKRTFVYPALTLGCDF